MKPGIESVSMFRNVQIRVKQTIGQDPWLSFPSLPPVYLAGRTGEPPATSKPMAVEAPAVSVQLLEAERLWPTVKDSTSIATLEAFVVRYRDTFYGDLAKSRLAELRQAGEVAKRTSEDDARAEGERKRLALLQQDEARKAVEAEAVRKRAEAASAMAAGRVFRDCPDCPEMVVVPAGEFMMGSPADEPERSANEDPQHKVMIGKPFAAGKFEVTFAEWDACVSDGGCKHKPGDASWGRGKRPVIKRLMGRHHGGIPAVAVEENGQDLSAADGGGVGVRGTGRHDHPVFDGLDDHHRAGQFPQQLHLQRQQQGAIPPEDA